MKGLLIRHRAFSFIEVLIVTIVLGIIVGVAYPGYVKMRESMLDKQAKMSLRLIEGAEKVYRSREGIDYTSTRIDSINLFLRINLHEQDWNFDIQKMAYIRPTTPITVFLHNYCFV